MLIGSNNSLTYLRPSTWWSKIIRWFGKCQSISYEEQYIYYGIRLFDIKLYTNEYNHAIIKNGIFKYTVFSFYEVLDFFNRMGDVTVLLTLDEFKSSRSVEYKFTDICNIIETIYPNIRFCGGYRTFDKKKLYEFNYEKKNGMPKIVFNNSWVFKYLPFISSLKNKQMIRKHSTRDGYLMLNYVNRR